MPQMAAPRILEREFRGGTMNKSVFKVLALLAMIVSFSSALASPAAYVERNAYVQFGYQFGSGNLFAAIGAEVPLGEGFPIDLSVGGELNFRKGIGATVSAKGLVFPSLLGNPPIALAAAAEVSVFDAAGFGWRSRIGVISSFDFSPFVLTLAPYFGFGSGGASFDLDSSARYYFDPFALEANLNYSTLGTLTGSLGLRFLF
jgi:ribose/xylose/arabinose/galactoside ABC-type transport system permease subunit